MTININISSTKNRYGYILQNAEASSGSGGLGTANHDGIDSMFDHNNAVLSGATDQDEYSIAAKFLLGRNNLTGQAITTEIAQLKTDLQTRRDSLDAQSDSEEISLLNDEIGALGNYLNTGGADGGAPTPEALKDIEDLLDEIQAADSKILDDAFNPDFPNFDMQYNYTRHGGNRSNDLGVDIGGNASGKRAPNVDYPKYNPDYDNWEVDIDSADVVTPYSGGGGFGPNMSIGIPQHIATIISKYTPQQP